MGACVMTSRRHLERVGLLDERFFFYAEDIDWAKRFWEHGLSVVYYPLPQVVHYGGGSSNSTPVSFRIEMMRADLAYYSKHFSIFQYLANYAVLMVYHVLRSCFMLLLFPFNQQSSEYKRMFIKREFLCFMWLMKNGFKKVETTRKKQSREDPL